MHRTRSQLAVAAVALVLGLLVVVQVRAQAGGAGLAQLSSQDLTVLVANLNARNDQLRREISSLEDELVALNQNHARGEASVDELRADLRRVRAYAGLDPVGGPGVTISISGPIDGSGVEELINELRNAGAEAIGAPDKLTGSLTRSGGVIAQLAATEPEVTVTVTPVDRIELPATTRTLVPAHGQPRL